MKSRKAQALAWVALILLGPGLAIWVMYTARLELRLRNDLAEPIREVRLVVADDEEWSADELRAYELVTVSVWLPAELPIWLHYRVGDGAPTRAEVPVYLSGPLWRETELDLAVFDGGVRGPRIFR